MDEGTLERDVRREIKRARTERGMTQAALSAKSGIDRATLNQIEKGRRVPTIETLGKLADGLECEVAEFFPKVVPSLFDPEPRRVSKLPGIEAGRVLSAEELEGWQERTSRTASPEVYAILHAIEKGETTADEAGPDLVGAIVAALRTGGHAPAT